MLNVMNKIRWSEDQKEILRKRYPHDHLDTISTLLNGTYSHSQIRRKVNAMGLRRNPNRSAVDVPTGKNHYKWQPVGTIRKGENGMLKIKSHEGVRPWPNLSNYNWEQVNGKVPAGHMIIFKDRDISNADISNLECIPMSENLSRNSIHNLPEEIKEVIRLKSRITRKINGK